ncbi:MAG: DUF2867 domain-containing protein, partial [Parvularculaceae bacterium]|nr:DUF2867 domain-containing protein [Parvularculaceae bacterium]
GTDARRFGTSTDPDKEYEAGGEIWRWRIYSLEENEVITGLDDKHLDFRVSLMRPGKGDRYYLSTIVNTKNLFGKCYMAIILPFHRVGVRSLLTSAARDGRI